MPRTCRVAGCSSSAKNGRSLFTFPKDQDVSHSWLSIGGKLKEGKSLSDKNFHICDLHFAEGCFEDNENEISLDGSVIVMKRKRRRLKKGSIPTIFEQEDETKMKNIDLQPQLLKLCDSKSVLSHRVVPRQKVKENFPVETRAMPRIVSSVPFNMPIKKTAVIDIISAPIACMILVSPAVATTPSFTEYSIPAAKHNHSTESLEKSSSVKSPAYQIEEEAMEDLNVTESYTADRLLDDWNRHFPEGHYHGWCLVLTPRGQLFCKNDRNEDDVLAFHTRTVTVKPDMTAELFVKGRVANCPFSKNKVTSFKEFLDNFLASAASLRICEGNGYGKICENVTFKATPASRTVRCKNCQILRKREKEYERIRTKRAAAKAEKKRKSCKKVTWKYRLSLDKITKLQNEISKLQEQCAGVKEEVLDKALEEMEELPNGMKETIKSCWRYSKSEDKRGMRYKMEWILECLLIRIKSSKAYLHLLNHQILPVPTIKTLNNYIKNYKPCYGFDEQFFTALGKKGAAMNPEDKRGCLVVDEMAINEGVYFNSNDFQVKTFTDLGEYTPEKQTNSRRSEALVFLFQPFRGQWVQDVVAFLSKGYATGQVLWHLIMEAIILLENQGFYVDAVCSDGGRWNRSMWKCFGIKEDEVSCVHPCAEVKSSTIEDEENDVEERCLWFISDFSHLVKTFRNFFVTRETITSHEGVIRKRHFRALLQCDGGRRHIKVAHKLTEDHLNPKNFLKMSVPMAFDLFSMNVVAGLMANRNDHPDLDDCEPTISFVKRMSKLIEAMTSRSIINSLSFGSQSYKDIIEFLKYLDDWEAVASKNKELFHPANAFRDFRVTLRSALEIMEFLTTNFDYTFLMTARLTQDALEMEQMDTSPSQETIEMPMEDVAIPHSVDK